MFDHHQILSSSITSPSKYNPCNPEFLRKYCEIFLTGKYVLSIDAGVGTVGPPSMTKNHSALQVKIADMCDLTLDSMPSIFILYYFPPQKKHPKKNKIGNCKPKTATAERESGGQCCSWQRWR